MKVVPRFSKKCYGMSLEVSAVMMMESKSVTRSGTPSSAYNDSFINDCYYLSRHRRKTRVPFVRTRW